MVRWKASVRLPADEKIVGMTFKPCGVMNSGNVDERVVQNGFVFLVAPCSSMRA